MMTPVLKLSIMHKQIMLMFQGEALINTGHLTEGWKKNKSIQRTVVNLENKINLLQKQTNSTKLANEDQDQLKSFKSMLEKDLKNTIFNLQNDKFPEELIQLAKRYTNQMKDLIDLLNVAIVMENISGCGETGSTHET